MNDTEAAPAKKQAALSETNVRAPAARMQKDASTPILRYRLYMSSSCFVILQTLTGRIDGRHPRGYSVRMVRLHADDRVMLRNSLTSLIREIEQAQSETDFTERIPLLVRALSDNSGVAKWYGATGNKNKHRWCHAPFLTLCDAIVRLGELVTVTEAPSGSEWDAACESVTDAAQRSLDALRTFTR